MMEIRDWLLTISMIGHFSYTAWAYIERRNDKTNEKVAALTGQVEAVERKVAGLTQAVETAPNHNHLGEIYEAIKRQGEANNKHINDLAATVHQLVGENRGQSDMLRSIFNRLAEKGMP